MIPKMITAVYSGKEWAIKGKLWQYDYGKVLRIQGLPLPTAVEIQFSLDSSGGGAVTRIGLTTDGVTDVVLPDSLLENDNTDQSYYIHAFIYLTDDDSGSTVHMIRLHVTARAKPEASLSTDETALWSDVKALIEGYTEDTATNALLAQSYAVGGTDTREDEDTDNAKFYAKIASDVLASLIGQATAAKAEIDEYVDGKEEELKGDTGDVYFAAFKVVDGRLIMYSDPDIDKVVFYREGSRLYYRLAI